MLEPNCQNARKITSRLLVTGRHPAVGLPSVEEPLDPVPLLVQRLIVLPRGLAGGPRRDHRLGPLRLDRRDELVTVLSLLCDHGRGLVACDQILRPRQVVGLPRRQDYLHRVAQGVDRDLYLDAEPAARAASRLVVPPLFRPPRRVDGHGPQSRRSAATPGRRRRPTPPSPGPRPRVGPRGGTAGNPVPVTEPLEPVRPGAPGRAIQSTALMTRRLSVVIPGDSGRPGRRCSIRLHASSESLSRRIGIALRDQSSVGSVLPPSLSSTRLSVNTT
jgi:hypothetical protein